MEDEAWKEGMVFCPVQTAELESWEPQAAGAEGWQRSRRLLPPGAWWAGCVWVGSSVLGEARGALH